jgi:hypothetical protein
MDNIALHPSSKNRIAVFARVQRGVMLQVENPMKIILV